MISKKEVEDVLAEVDAIIKNVTVKPQTQVNEYISKYSTAIQSNMLKSGVQFFVRDGFQIIYNPVKFDNVH